MPITDEPTQNVALDRQRWTHMALCVSDIDRSIDWYEKFTHLRLFKKMQDANGYGAWLVDPDQPDPPFLLVLAEFFEGKDPFAPAEHGSIGPFAHFGIEMLTKESVDQVAELGKSEDCLAFGPTQMPDPIGYVCFLQDPDDNTIEFSFNQGVYEAVRTEWKNLKTSTSKT
ncbi:MAG: VOC family protein [Pseudomonadota bacterium]